MAHQTGEELLNGKLVCGYIRQRVKTTMRIERDALSRCLSSVRAHLDRAVLKNSEAGRNNTEAGPRFVPEIDLNLDISKRALNHLIAFEHRKLAVAGWFALVRNWRICQVASQCQKPLRKSRRAKVLKPMHR